MKRNVVSLTALTVLAVMALSCTHPSSGTDKFMGHWKRADKPEKDTLIIEKEPEDIVIFKGKDTLRVRADHGLMKIYGLSTTVISYNEKTGHVLVNKGADGEFKRLP